MEDLKGILVKDVASSTKDESEGERESFVGPVQKNGFIKYGTSAKQQNQ